MMGPPTGARAAEEVEGATRSTELVRDSRVLSTWRFGGCRQPSGGRRTCVACTRHVHVPRWSCNCAILLLL